MITCQSHQEGENTSKKAPFLASSFQKFPGVAVVGVVVVVVAAVVAVAKMHRSVSTVRSTSREKWRKP